MARRSGAATREAIEGAAARLFGERGFARTSVRTIAADARVDPALVIRHFGSKEQLFLDTMRVELGSWALVDSPVEELGERIVAHLLDADEQVRGVFLAMVRASDAGEIGSALRRAHEEEVVVPLRDRLVGPDAETRARLVAAGVGGLLYALWIVGDESLARADRATLVRLHGAALQALITP